MKKNMNSENWRIKSRQGTEKDKGRKVKGQRKCQAIRKSVKETVSLLLKINPIILLRTTPSNVLVKQNLYSLSLVESSFTVLPNISLSVLPVEWSSAVLNCISDANSLYDAVFERQAVYLDVTEAFQV